jgi:c-di-GMP-binding flagellar brake protein YcgR
MERRKYDRIRLLGQAEIRQSGIDHPIQAHILDMSYGGMQLYTKESITGTVKILLCNFKDLESGAEKWANEIIKAKVIQCKKKGAGFSVSVEFDALDSENHNRTLAFLDRYMWIK